MQRVSQDNSFKNFGQL